MSELKPEVGKTYSTNFGDWFTVVQQLENPLTYLTKSVSASGTEGWYQLIYEDLSFWDESRERESLLVEEIVLPQFNYWNAIKPSIDSMYVVISQDLKIRRVNTRNHSGQEVTLMMHRLFGLSNLISNPREGHWMFHRHKEAQSLNYIVVDT